MSITPEKQGERVTGKRRDGLIMKKGGDGERSKTRVSVLVCIENP